MSTAAALPAAPRFNAELGAAAGLVLVMFVMVVPLPGVLLDLLLAVNIAVSLAILLTAFYAERPLDFAIFPGLLLVTTLFRLALNVASTRLILGEAQAGALIDAFGHFVVGGNFVVGGIVFLVLVLINFMVITKGSGRIAEVGARFTLDALPGKQMAIDADLNAGLIDEPTAKQRRSRRLARGRLLRRDGRRVQVRPRRRRRRAHHHEHQHRRRAHHRGDAEGDGAEPRRPRRSRCSPSATGSSTRSRACSSRRRRASS